MAGSVNLVMIIGHLGRDPEVRQANGQTVCNFSMACNETWKDRDGKKQERVEWVRVVVWGPTADACGKYLAKGRQAYVEGRLQTRKWQNKDGVDVYTTEVVARNVVFLGGKADGGGRQEDPPPPGDEDVAF